MSYQLETLVYKYRKRFYSWNSPPPTKNAAAGAVGLTLGLIVVEDEDIVGEEKRSLILFYIAGIAAMTLVINGSLAGPLVHYLGLDRSTTAETEVFVRACSAVEARLEHKV